MPPNQRKIITIILEQCKCLEDRCDGYKEEVVDTITEIISLERQHQEKGINIQQKISDKCNAAGDFLARKRVQNEPTEESY